MLYDKINIGMPAIWVHSPDVSRASSMITSVCNRHFFKISRDFGFCQYVDNSWKPVLVDNPALQDNPEAPVKVVTDNFSIALHYITSSNIINATFIIELITDHKENANFVSSYAYSSIEQYKEAFWSDALEKMPIQYLVISSDPLPDEYVHIFSTYSLDNPSISELASIVSHIDEKTDHIFVNEPDKLEIAKAGIGLSELSFIDLCLTSIQVNSSIDPKFIYDQKMAKIKEHGILEIIKPKITFNDIGGLENIKDIIRRVSTLRKDKRLASEYGIVPIRRVLMVGIPGTGKSAICQATAAELNLDLARTGISQVMNSFIGQSEANMRAVFNQIKALSPLCVWIDEFGRDLSGGSSSSHVDGGTTDRVHGEFLTGLQELPEESFLLCAANELHALKPEMLRADRFDKIFFVGLPAHNERSHIFKINLSSIQTDHSFDYDALAEASAFMTGAEIVTLIRETKFYVVSGEMRPINTQDILQRIPQMKNTIWQKHPDMVKSMYQHAVQQWDWASNDQFEDAQKLLGIAQKSTPKVKFG
jgi:ATP-dependent Zn protease